MSLKLKLIILFLAVALIPLFFVSALTFHNYKNSLETTCLSNLQDVAAFKADKIETYFAGLKSRIEIAQGFYNIKTNLPILTRLAGDPNNPQAAASRKMLEAQLQQMQSVSDMSDIMLVNPKGTIVYANKPGHYFKDLSTGLDVEQMAFTAGKDGVYFSDAYYDKVEDNRFEMLVTAPASDFNGVFIGVIVFEVDMTSIYKIMQDVTGLGKTGEVLVGKQTGNQVMYLNPPRHEPQAVLKNRITIGQKTGGPIQEAVQGKTGAGQLIDYRDKKVIAAWRYIPSLKWGMVAKIDTEEAFAEVTKLRNLALIILAIVIILSSITAFSIARSISEPIKRLSHGAEIIGSGNLDYKVGTPLKDEIGQLSRSFDKMTGDLKQTLASRDELNREIAERKRIEDALKFLVQCGEPSSGEDFFQSLARYLGESLGMNFVCIDRLEENLLVASTVAVYSDGKFEDNVSYTLKDTPCGDVVGKTICCFAKDVRHLFPNDAILANLAAESYIGTTLWSSQGKPIGLIAIIGRKPLADTKLAKSILQLAAVRAAGELERRQSEEAVLVSEVRYRRLFEAARDGILILDADSGQIVNVNPFIKDMLGYSQEEFLDKKLWEIGLFKDIAASKEAFLELQNKDYIRYENLPFETKDGRRIAVEFVSNVYQVDRKRVFQCNIRDITDRIQAEESLRKSRDELEIRVKDRTKELAQTVDTLENEIQERILAEKAVRQGEERYRSLTVATTQVIWSTNAQGEVVDDMPFWRAFTGQSVEAIKGRGWIESLHPDDRQRTTEIWTQSVQDKKLHQTEYRVRRHDGEYRDMSVCGVPVLEQDGSTREWVKTCTDITERKLAQEKQAVTNSLLELFVKKSLRKEYLDAVVEDIRNWSGCEFVGIRVKDNEDNIPYESSVGFNDDFLAAENALHLGRDNCVCIRAIMENHQKHEMNFITAGGSFYYNDSHAFLNGLTDPQKKENRGTCIKCGFQSIAVVPIRYRDEVMGAIHITDFQKDMVSLSKIQFIEATISPLVGEAIHRFTAESELEKYRLHLEELVRQRTHELERANRQLYSEAIHRQQIADDLARSNKDLEQFAYVASHDLQEPLRAVSGFVELLKRNLQKSLDAKTTEYMNFTVDGTRRMHSLINGLLEYSRVSARGKNPQQTDSKTALDLAIAHLLAGIKESEAILTIDELPKVHVDAVQLTQLFQNLIGNALKFRGEQPLRIHIGAARQGDAWRFAVTDNGIGIETQYAERIFLIFQRLHTRQKYPGTGIGLAICKKIIERHGGKIWVESKPEKGSTFYFTIPDIEIISQDG